MMIVDRKEEGATEILDTFIQVLIVGMNGTRMGMYLIAIVSPIPFLSSCLVSIWGGLGLFSAAHFE